MTRSEAKDVYKVQHERFRQTKDLQWKINLASWALISLAISSYSKFKGQVKSDQLLLVTIAFFLAQMIFAYRTQRALEADKIISRTILLQLNKSTDGKLNIEVDIKMVTKKGFFGPTGWWWIVFQGFTTGTLLVIFYLMAS